MVLGRLHLHSRELANGHASGKTTVDLDRSVPALMVRLGRSPLHHGTLGAIRTLGRLGVPVYAVLEDRFNPAGHSRYLRDGFVWPTTGCERPSDLVDGLRAIGAELDRRLGRPVIALATGDHAAIILAEHAEALREYFLVPEVSPGLPRMLASKLGLQDLCRTNGVPTPLTLEAASPNELVSIAEEFGYPLVVKNPEPWKCVSGSALSGTTVVRSRESLATLMAGWAAMPPIAVQEYLPEERCQDWIVHAYCDENGRCLVDFTGMKLRSMPREAGPTAFACTVRNEILAGLASDFCQRIGFCGIADLDWRFDELDGSYKLLDFNPRMGAQFRLFETESGVDVVRAMHLHLTDRPVPAGKQVDGRRIIVENLDAMATVTYRRNGGTRPAPVARTSTELAWLALDDPLPAVLMTARVVGPAAAQRLRKMATLRGHRGPGKGAGA